jgi:hypothetical protein
LKDDGSMANSIYLGQWLSLPDNLQRRRSTYYLSSFPPTLHQWYQGAYWEYGKHAWDLYFHSHSASSQVASIRWCSPHS